MSRNPAPRRTPRLGSSKPLDVAFSVAMLAVLVGSVVAIAVSWVHGHRLLALTWGAGAAAICLISSRLFVRRRVADALRENRQGLEPQPLPSSLRIERSRRKCLALAMALTAIFAVIAALVLLMADAAAFGFLAAFGLPLLAIAWLVGLLRGGGWIATLQASGIDRPGGTIPWSSIANLELCREPRSDRRFLAITLVDPLLPRGGMAQLNSWLSRGASDREVHVKLGQSDQEPELVYDTAAELWRTVVGAAPAEAARRARMNRVMQQNRRFGDLPTPEKMRQGRVIFWILLVSALGVHGALADFSAAAAWSRISIWMSIVVAVVGIAWLIARRGLASLRNERSTMGYFPMFLVLLVALWAGTWLILGRSLPDLYTRIAGERREIIETLRQVDSGRKCRHKIRGGLLDRGFPGRYCASRAEAAALPRSGPMVLKVRESWFGTRVDAIEPVSLK